jgi:hypothetical protein
MKPLNAPVRNAWTGVHNKEDAMRTFVLTLGIACLLSVSAAGTALGADPHAGTTGQPNQSCQAEPATPGNSASAPGSAFNTSGVAGTHYAGTQPQNSKNPNSVSQYDVACFQVSHH